MPYADPTVQRDYQRRAVARTRAEFFAGKKCASCRTTDSLEVHHLDPTQKEAHSIWSWSPSRRLLELAKCVVLCAPCHRSLHAAFRRAKALRDNPHGTRNRYELGCGCSECRNAKWADNREWRARRSAA